MKCRWLVAAACASALLGGSLEAAESSAANVIERYDLQEADAPVKERKGSVHVPKQVVVTDSVPITALGKPDKKAVRAQFWEGSGRSVG